MLTLTIILTVAAVAGVAAWLRRLYTAPDPGRHASTLPPIRVHFGCTYPAEGVLLKPFPDFDKRLATTDELMALAESGNMGALLEDVARFRAQIAVTA